MRQPLTAQELLGSPNRRKLRFATPITLWSSGGGKRTLTLGEVLIGQEGRRTFEAVFYDEWHFNHKTPLAINSSLNK